MAAKAAKKPTAKSAAAKKKAAAKALAAEAASGDDEMDGAHSPAVKTEPKASGSSAKKGALVTVAHTPVNPAVLAFNAIHLEFIKECLTVIFNCPDFQGIVESGAISQLEGAREAPFALDGYIASIDQCGSAKAGCNFFWQDAVKQVDIRLRSRIGLIYRFGGGLPNI